MIPTRASFPRRLALVVLLTAILVPASLCAQTGDKAGPVKPGKADKCPVCGMFAAKYPGWNAQVRLADGAVVHFDGAKDCFRFLQEPGRWLPGRTSGDVRETYVTNYYDGSPLEVRKAFYVLGSDVLGPMGHELIPLAGEAEAKDFLRDHKGRKILRFDEITPAVLKTLE